MSKQKRISPLLDGFSLGSPMSEHDGVRCCPAIKENTDKKYIVKVITIPASQVQLDALLLAGAYKDPADAMAYYKGVGESVMKEAQLLKELSKLDGFLPYEGWQMEPIARRRLGYEVYLVGSYKRSLEKYVRKNPFTHLQAVNLGLDLCAALAVCRQAGSLYVDLKPSNIFVSEKKEYRIGDLGFIALDALRYTTLPEKYRSVYTAPETFDPMAPLNLTMDTYAVGMILYQLYNEGQLPFKEKAPEEVLPSPINADYELSEIIMKAIHPDPEQRWQDPADMGKALASYMQRNSINDVPITPHTPLIAEAAKPIAPPEAAEVITVASEEGQIEKPPEEEIPTEVEVSQEELPEPVLPEEESQNSEDVADAEEDAEPSGDANSPEESAEPIDDTAPAEEDADTLLPHEMSEELSRMMAKADDLIAHETPEGVIVPELSELPDPFAFIAEDSDEVDDSDVPLDPVMDDPDEETKEKKPKRTFASQKGKQVLKKLLSGVLSLLIVALVLLTAFGYYKFFYLQTIRDILITGDMDQLTVRVDSDIEPSELYVICTDQYGNARKQSLSSGQAAFTGLTPNTLYTITLEIDGFHKLIGQTSDVFTTDATTNIVSFHAVTGSDDGSVMLTFTADGEEPREWTVTYQAEGEESKKKTFTGHSVTIEDLTIGKVYTFTLDAGKQLSLSGSKTTDYLASRLILAQELRVTSSGNSDITVHWKAPGDIVVDTWDVRCYSDSGYEKKLTVSDTSVYLTGIDFDYSYTVEVTASGMTQPARTNITAQPINITGFHTDDSALDQLSVSWDYDGNDPEGGWLLMYSVDNGNTQSVVKAKTASEVSVPKIPNARYLFIIQAADGTSVFSSTHSYQCPAAEGFHANKLSAENVEAMLVKTPEDAYWHFGKLESDAVTDQFAAGDPISVVLHATTDFYLPGAQSIEILYVIRDAYGNVIPDLVTTEDAFWKEIWNDGDYHYAELDIPSVPEAAGDYTLNIFFNGYTMAEVSFTITQ